MEYTKQLINKLEGKNCDICDQPIDAKDREEKRFHYSYMGLFCRGTSLYGSISFTLRGMVDCMGPLASYLSYCAHLPQKVTYSPLCSSPHIPDL